MSCLARHTSRPLQIWNRLLWLNSPNVFINTHRHVQPRWTQDSTGTRQVTYDVRNNFFPTEKTSLEKPFDKVSTTKVASNIELRKIQRSSEQATEVHTLQSPDRTRTLVIIFFPFLTSQNTVDRYSSIYHNHGLDVLAVRGRVPHFLRPSSGRTLAREILEYLSENETPLNTSRFVFHSVSFGDYLYALVLNEISEHPRKYDVAKRKISGQIFDSLTAGTPSAFPTQLLGDRFRYLSEKSVGLYFSAFGAHRNFREKVLDAFGRGPVKGSALVFCCFDDPLSDVRSVDKIIENWRRGRVLDVAVSSWAVSTHGRHFHRYPEQYRRAIDTFLVKLCIVARTDTVAALR